MHTTMAKVTFAAGIGVFVLVVLMALVGGNPRPAVLPNEHGYTSAMYWFERVESVDDLFSALGQPNTEEGMRIRHAMDCINKIDFAFMFAYSIFFACLYVFFASRRKHEGRRNIMNLVIAAGIIVSCLMLLGDIFENIQLLKLTKVSSEAEVDVSVIALLMFFTRLKWFTLFFASIGFAVVCASGASRNRWWYPLALVYATSAIIGFASFFIPGFESALELSANLMGAGWLISTIHAGYMSLKKNSGA